MKIFYEKDAKIYKFNSKLYEKVIMYNPNYQKHIRKRHPEMTLELIETILMDPDYIWKASRNRKDRFFEKTIDSTIYRVVIDKIDKGRRCVVTAYAIDEDMYANKKRVYCVFDKSCDEGIIREEEGLYGEEGYWIEVCDVDCHSDFTTEQTI